MSCWENTAECVEKSQASRWLILTASVRPHHQMQSHTSLVWQGNVNEDSHESWSTRRTIAAAAAAEVYNYRHTSRNESATRSCWNAGFVMATGWQRGLFIQPDTLPIIQFATVKLVFSISGHETHWCCYNICVIFQMCQLCLRLHDNSRCRHPLCCLRDLLSSAHLQGGKTNVVSWKHLSASQLIALTFFS